jgi:hypothetical protein
MAESILDIIFRTKKTGSGEKEAVGGLKNLASQFEHLTGVNLGAAAAFGAVTAAVKFSITAAMESEKTTAQLNAALESTGYAAGLNAGQLEMMAAAMSDLTAVDDDLIKGGEALLLTFTNIGANVFPGAMNAALDMSAALGQDLNSSVLQLGKALNDPIKGITALSRVGVSFTQDQKDMIETLVETGDTIGAQKLILAELNKEFGGSAAAAADTYAGKLQKLQNSLENLGEAIGSSMLPALAIQAEGLRFQIDLFAEDIAMMNEGVNILQILAYNQERYAALELNMAMATQYESDFTREGMVAKQAATEATIAYMAAQEEATTANNDAAGSAQDMAESYSAAAIEAGLAAKESVTLAAGARELANAEQDLKTAQDDLALAQENWKKGAGGQIAGMLEQAGLKGDDFYLALDTLDQMQGTNEGTTARQKDAMQLLVNEYARTGDIEAFRQGLQNLNDSFMPLDESIKSATNLVDILQDKVDTLEGVYWITVRARDESGLGVLDGNNDNNNNNMCFLAGTPVSVPGGSRPIEEIQIGDLVSVLQENGEVVAARVGWRKVSERDDLVAVTLSDGQAIMCSPNHKWKLACGDWSWAINLEQNDLLVSDHGPVWVRFVEEYPGRHAIYNFTIDHAEHTFLVGGIVVHNVEAKAAGGDLYQGRMYMVGEQGPELLQLGGGGGRAGHVYPNEQVTGAGVQFTGDVYINNGMDFEELMFRINQRLGRK